jgi:hypothetical protein
LLGQWNTGGCDELGMYLEWRIHRIHTEFWWNFSFGKCPHGWPRRR